LVGDFAIYRLLAFDTNTQRREKLPLEIGGNRFDITGTPCEHLPGGEVTGFIISKPSFGTTNGKPNAIYFSGDTNYLPELAKMKEQYRKPRLTPPLL
jgi:hypothetical protein